MSVLEAEKRAKRESQQREGVESLVATQVSKLKTATQLWGRADADFRST